MTYRILIGDVFDGLRALPDASVQCCVTSPPYWGLRDYGVPGQLGLEPTPEEYAARMVEVFREVRRVLRDDGTLWLVLGDSYAASGNGGNPPESQYQKQARNAGSLIPGRKAPQGLKPKDLVGIPWRVAFALQADGWYLRQDIIWHKPNPMPESVTDRCCKSHEYVFLLAKSERYFYDAEAVKEDATDCKPRPAKKADRWNGQAGHDTKAGFLKGKPAYFTRNRRSVWTVATQSYSEAHFATFPEEIPRRCILAGTSARGASPSLCRRTVGICGRI